MKFIDYSVRNPLIVNLLMVAIFLLGTAAFFEMPRELSPKITFNYIFIIIPYPGAGAEEVEKIITTKVEDAVDDVEDIKMMSAESSEGSSFVWLQFEDLSDREFRERMNEVESLVNQVELPEGALDPIVDDFNTDDFIPLISVSVVGDMPERKLHRLSEDLKTAFMDIDGVAKVSVTGTREREIWIEADARKLYQHRLSLSQIVQSVGAKNLNIPAGELYIGRESRLVRTVGEVKSPDGFKKIVVRWDPSGNHVYLGQVAVVEDRWKRETSRARIDGAASATLSVSRKSSANTLSVIAEVKKVSETFRKDLPAGSKLVFTNDNAIYMKDILSKLQNNAMMGFLLVVLILYFFLGFRNALIVALGIPIAFAATFFLMGSTGQSINGSSLFGLMLVLGMVVDDAIIVVENRFRLRHEGHSRHSAAINGAKEVFWPVVSATATTIAAFLPLMLMSGIIGKFMRIIPMVVSLTLAASLVEVFIIAPSHFAEWGATHKGATQIWFVRLRKRYTNILVRIIRKRYLIGPVLLVLMIALGVSIPLLVGVELYSGDEWSQFSVHVTMPSGTTLNETDRVLRQMEETCRDLPDEEIHALIANAGFLQTDADWIFSDHVGQMVVDAVEPELRERSLDEIMADVRKRISTVQGPISVVVKKPANGPPVGKPVEIKIKGKELDVLQKIADELKAELAKIPGVKDIANDNLIGKKEVQLVIDEDRAAMAGLNVAMIATEVRAAIEGVEASIYREGDEEIDVRVKLLGGEDFGVEGLSALTLTTPTGAQVRLGDLCRFEVKPSLYRIKRFEGERAVTVSSEIDKKVTSAVKVNNVILDRYKGIGLKYPGYRLDMRGEFREFQEAFSDLGRLFLIGLILIFVILGAQFKSIRISFIIMATIPFAFIGAMIGLLVSNNPLSIVAMYGMVALAGIAVNDAIVMISFINESRARGAGKWISIIQSGRGRLRPIILTSVTTILGLLPMAIGLGGRSASWQPLAATIVWGLTVATLLTLFVIPSMYSIIVDDWFGIIPLKKWLRKRHRKDGE